MGNGVPWAWVAFSANLFGVNEVTFVKQREPDWKRLNMLCDRADVTPKALNQHELREFIQLYRRASSDLALARTQSGNLQLVEFLNDLVGRAYVILYRPTRGRFFQAIKTGIEHYAAAARRQKIFIFAAALLFFLGAFFSGGIMQARPDLRSHFVSPGMEGNFDHWKDGMDARSGEESFMMTGFYMSNNPRVSIITGALAAGTFGILTAQLLWMNGIMVGALGSEMHDVGKLPMLVAWIIPHGMTEIQGIFISGGAGFLMGWTMIFPGQRRRGDALKDAAKDGLVLLTGSVILMMRAAPFEGFVGFNPNIPDILKVVVALLVGIAWFLFYKLVGRHLDAKPVVAPAAG